VLLLLPALAFAAAAAAPPSPIRIELNAAAALQNQCSLSFVIENKDGAALRSLKLDLVLFGRDGVISRRLIAEMGPLRAAKTVVKAFAVDGDCAALGSVLVNDVTACVPGEADACLARLELHSRIPDIRLFK
jgi:hypothetical protein